MNDIEILKLAVKSTARKMFADVGLKGLAPLVNGWLDGAMEKGVFQALLYGFTTDEGNVNIQGLTKALEDALKDFGGKLKGKMLGFSVAIVPEDVQMLPKEFDAIKANTSTLS